jgi:hypothetical protein
MLLALALWSLQSPEATRTLWIITLSSLLATLFMWRTYINPSVHLLRSSTVERAHVDKVSACLSRALVQTFLRKKTTRFFISVFLNGKPFINHCLAFKWCLILFKPILIPSKHLINSI